ncbi:MAG: DUF308 domain-containing protein [Xanthobacteraceae bacterium]|nr:DUF308 domain-containing protein [Xanthobacteraceae bacterium]
MIVLLIAGIGAIVAGLLAIWFGIPVKEFSFGNTMILAGVVGVCTGLILIGLAFVVRELKAIARRLGSSVRPAADEGEFGAAPLPAGSIADIHPAERRSPRRGRFADAPAEVPVPPLDGPAVGAAPREATGDVHDDVHDEPRGVAEAPEQPAASGAKPPPERPRRNLLFQSSRRERAQGAEPSPSAAEVPPQTRPHPSFDDAWPRRENVPRVPPPPAPAPQSSADVSVVKSGVVDGMAYSLYSDGSIEAQMPEGMMRFASIDELRKHLDQRS